LSFFDKIPPYFAPFLLVYFTIDFYVGVAVPPPQVN